MARRFKSTMHGVLVVDKPVGPSSMQAVARVRRAAGQCKTGHAGTLDPLASGVLVCCLGRATKCSQWIMDQRKIYETRIDLSAFTMTDDAEGERELVAVEQAPELGGIARVCEQLTGWIDQCPPAYSAIKINGERAYRLARRGESVSPASRQVRVDGIEILSYTWPELTIRVTCGKGTYIRSLARQIGQGLGTGGYLQALRRLAVGDYTIDRAVSLDGLPDSITEDDLLPVPEVSGS